MTVGAPEAAAPSSEAPPTRGPRREEQPSAEAQQPVALPPAEVDRQQQPAPARTGPFPGVPRAALEAE
eukprot:443953-Lingulodinium_polyedra.AAC.1